jgi:hypothetical protein
MRLSSALVASAVAGSATAFFHNHEEYHEKRWAPELKHTACPSVVTVTVWATGGECFARTSGMR